MRSAPYVVLIRRFKKINTGKANSNHRLRGFWGITPMIMGMSMRPPKVHPGAKPHRLVFNMWGLAAWCRLCVGSKNHIGSSVCYVIKY
jgi:hypothetical protein